MINISLRGYLVGHIWQPGLGECFKPLSYDITREDHRFTEPGTLRDHILAATNDGDFQSCSLAAAELVATRTERKEGRTVTVERRWPLECFKSIADCLHPDRDWCPQYPEDFED
jgi:hypothetical protein